MYVFTMLQLVMSGVVDMRLIVLVSDLWTFVQLNFLGLTELARGD